MFYNIYDYFDKNRLAKNLFLYDIKAKGIKKKKKEKKKHAKCLRDSLRNQVVIKRSLSLPQKVQFSSGAHEKCCICHGRSGVLSLVCVTLVYL